MAVKYQDYYETLGVNRNSSQDEIQSAYRKLARKYHPDINKAKGAEDRFKKIGEAYEVLKDPAKRKRYDQLGANWKMGDDFTPPPGWDFFGSQERQSGESPRNFNFGFGGSRDTGFSDFFDTLFGGVFDGFGNSSVRAERAGNSGRNRPGEDHETDLKISLVDAYRGGRKSITLRISETAPDGSTTTSSKTLEVDIPAGVTDGKRLRLSGQGGSGSDGSKKGDLYLNIHIRPDSRFKINGRDIEVDIPIAPWEAALGAKIKIPLVSGTAQIKIPPGIQGGKRIRVKGKGLGGGKDPLGDLYAIVKIIVPKNLSSKEKELYQELEKVSSYDPRTL